MWLRRLITIALVLGLVFRFFNLDRKVYWYDETMTSLRSSGYTQQEMRDRAYTGEVISVRSLLDTYQYPNPSRNLQDTWVALAKHPEHSPLYYLLARLWVQFFGNSIAAIRSLSACISLLAIPCMYWLCRELFPKPVILSQFGMAIVAISPFHVLYAQEAREYSLWTVTIIFSSAALLYALRMAKTAQSLLHVWLAWGLYALATALGFYAHPLAGLVAISHGLYVAAIEGWRGRQQIFAYLCASICGAILFFPWLWVVFQNFSSFVQNTISTSNPREDLHLIWGLNLSRIFIDVNQGMSPFNPLIYISLGLTLFAVYHLIRTANRQTWLFIVLLMGVTGLALIVPDVVLGGRRSNNLRYAIPCCIGIQLAVTYLLTAKVTVMQIPDRIKARWKAGTIALCCVGIISCAVSSQVQVWWHKSYAKSRHNPAIAQMINALDRPLIVSDEIPGRLLSFAHLLQPDAQLQLMGESVIPQLASGFNEMFLYRASDRLQQQIVAVNSVKIEPAYDKGWLLKIVPR
jgi:uncharacterized membrane protein